MFIVWGNHSFKKVMGQTGPYTCQRCGNQHYFQILRVAKWFTLFWIPIFPYSFKYFLACPICNFGRQMAKDEAKMLAAGVGQQYIQN